MAKYNHVDLPKRNATGKLKNKILSVTIYRKADYDADSSHLGKYDTKPDSDYSIDRRHRETCAVVDPQKENNLAKLERVFDFARAYFPHNPNEYAPGEEDVNNLYEQLSEDVAECDCGGVFIDHNSCEFFNPCEGNYLGCAPEEIRKYCRQDFDRAEALNNGEWNYIGIRAEARIGLPTGAPLSYLTQTIGSGGLWGIESDSKESYFAEVEKDELANLRDALVQLGFSRRAIATAFKTIKRKED